jgi:hypothetical protein
MTKKMKFEFGDKVNVLGVNCIFIDQSKDKAWVVSEDRPMQVVELKTKMKLVNLEFGRGWKRKGAFKL